MPNPKPMRDGFPEIIAKPNSSLEATSAAEIAAAWKSIKGIEIIEENFDSRGTTKSSRIEIRLKDGSVQRVNFKRDRIGRAEVLSE